MWLSFLKLFLFSTTRLQGVAKVTFAALCIRQVYTKKKQFLTLGKKRKFVKYFLHVFLFINVFIIINSRVKHYL